MKKNEKLKLYSALEVANICGVVNQTSINWIKKRYIKASTTPGGQYRISGENLARFMASRDMIIPFELQKFLKTNSKSVLLIEDDDLFARQFLDELNSEYTDYTVKRAIDCFEAGRKLTLGNMDLILINSDMIELDAERVCKVIRSEKQGESKYIIVFTAKMNKIKKETLLKAGADVYLEKPFDISQISIYLE